MALVQVTKSTDTNDGPVASVATAAFGSSVTAGNTVTGHVSWQGAATTDLTGVTDNLGNTYTVVDSGQIVTSGLFWATFIKQNAAGGAGGVITGAFSFGAQFRRISGQEWSSVSTTGQPHQHEINSSGAFGTGTDAVTSAVTTGQTTTVTCTLVGFAYDDSSATVPSVGTGFTSADSATFSAGDAFRIEYKTGDASGSGKKATFTTTAGTDNIGAALIALQETGGAGPTINTDPADVVQYTGQTANFTVSATASGGSLTYQWQVSTDRGATYNNVSAGSGGTTSSYTTAALVFADDQTFYRCAVTDSNGTTNTRGASLRVIGAGSMTWTKQ